MKIYSVLDPEFKPYGKIIEGFDTKELLEAMNKIELPAEGVAYEPAIDSLEACAIFKDLQDRAYGGMPIELGMCWGHNTLLNALEYHRDSELNLGTEDFILLLALESEIEDGVIDSSKVKAFRAPAGVMVEVYATTLHYAPCHVDPAKGFRVTAVLPKGTNGPKPGIEVCSKEDAMLWACNKWLIAHPDSADAKAGAFVGITGENIDIAADL